MAQPYPVALQLTRHNRNSIAALLALLETELPAGLVATRLVESLSDCDAQGLLVCSFTSLQAPAIAAELAALRLRIPGLRALAGGPHASGAPRETRALGFDWVVTGEARSSSGSSRTARLPTRPSCTSRPTRHSTAIRRGRPRGSASRRSRSPAAVQ